MQRGDGSHGQEIVGNQAALVPGVHLRKSLRQLEREWHRFAPRSEKKDRQLTRWRPGGLGDYIALVPWLCVTAFRRICSEQRIHVIARALRV